MLRPPSGSRRTERDGIACGPQERNERSSVLQDIIGESPHAADDKVVVGREELSRAGKTCDTQGPLSKGPF